MSAQRVLANVSAFAAAHLHHDWLFYAQPPCNMQRAFASTAEPQCLRTQLRHTAMSEAPGGPADGAYWGVGTLGQGTSLLQLAMDAGQVSSSTQKVYKDEHCMVMHNMHMAMHRMLECVSSSRRDSPEPDDSPHS